MKARVKTQEGFTIIELMISVGILAFMMMVTWSAFAQVAADRKHLDRFSNENREVRMAMTRMATDLSMAYLSSNEATTAFEPRTFFVGKRASEELLRFSSLGHRPLWSNANESEQTVIVYGLTSDREKRGQSNLVRRESRRMSDEGWDQIPYEADVLVHDVKRFELEYWDWRKKDWQPEWDSSQASERNRLPSRVRLKITVERNGKEVTYTTQARLMLQEQLSFVT